MFNKTHSKVLATKIATSDIGASASACRCVDYPMPQLYLTKLSGFGNCTYHLASQDQSAMVLASEQKMHKLISWLGGFQCFRCTKQWHNVTKLCNKRMKPKVAFI
eukprot:5387163-Amphidinium_carterae.3